MKRRTFQPTSRGSAAPAEPAGRGRYIVLRIVLIAFVVAFLAEFVPAPWAFHIGGRFTPLGQWDGYGPVQASNGGRYLLFTHLQGGVIARGGRPGAPSTAAAPPCAAARSCAPRAGGCTHSAWPGTMHGYLTTDGSPTDLSLSGGSPVPLPHGLVVAFHGTWNGPVLPVASTDGSFTEAFTPSGAIRKSAPDGHRRHRPRHPAERLGHRLRPGLPRAGHQRPLEPWIMAAARGPGAASRRPHGEACCPVHWATVDTSACRGNTFSVSTRWTSGSASRHASARTISR